MKLFFFDTETTGTNPNFDQIIQFGGIFGDYNEVYGEFIEEDSINQFINVHVPISEGASNVHHIHKKDLVGYDYIDAYIDKFLSFFRKADYVIGHNVDFDKGMIIGECKRLGIDFDPDAIKWLDTMKPTTQLVQARTVNGRLKWPKLIELYKFLFGKDFDGAHDAFADITATKDCFFELVKNFEIFSFPKPSLRKKEEFKKQEIQRYEYKFIGEVENGKPNGAGELYHYGTLIYKGTCFSDDLFWFIYFDGEGEKYNFDGTIKYVGTIKNGKYDGTGKTYYNGNIEYEGTFKDGFYHGKGKLYYLGVLEYEGDFYEGNFCGWGLNYSDSGNLIYEGRFNLGKYNGEGILYNEDGTIKYSGLFIRGYPEKVYNKKIIQKYLDYKNNSKNLVIQDEYDEDEYEYDNEEDYDAMHEYENGKSMEEYYRFYEDVDNQNLANGKYQRVKVRKLEDEIDDDNDDFYNQVYNEDDDVEFQPKK